MSPSPFQPDDADQILDDFGEDLEITAAPTVKRGLLDDVVLEQETAGQTTQSQRLVLKVKRGAFAGLATVKGLTVSIPSRGVSYVIDQPLARPTSLFDFYVLQVKRA